MSSASNAGAGMDALKQVNELQPDFQWYGGSRILGKYYQELPGLFGGSNKKALELLTTAITKAPNFRNNWVFLGQYYNSTGEADKALDACQKALQLPNQDGKYEEIRYSREAQECIDKAKAKLGKE
jgi:tetratricopeptide (TPR) repeat protein